MANTPRIQNNVDKDHCFKHPAKLIRDEALSKHKQKVKFVNYSPKFLLRVLVVPSYDGDFVHLFGSSSFSSQVRVEQLITKVPKPYQQRSCGDIFVVLCTENKGPVSILIGQWIQTCRTYFFQRLFLGWDAQGTLCNLFKHEVQYFPEFATCLTIEMEQVKQVLGTIDHLQHCFHELLPSCHRIFTAGRKEDG